MTMNNIAEWLIVLSHLQAASNNAYWSLTHQTLNKVLYDFWLSEMLDLLILTSNVSTESDLGSIMTVEAHLTDEECITEQVKLQKTWKKDLFIIMFIYQPSHIDVKNVIAWAAMQVKHYYNMNWQPQFFAVRDEVLLRLHHEYKLSEITNWKLKQQFIRLFKITEWIKYLIYCLNLSFTWKIHNIIFIAHLEPFFISFNDLYNWFKLTQLPLITVDSTDNYYKIKQLLQKWVSHWGCNYTTEYLIQ